MKVSVSVVLAHWTLCYFQYFLPLMLQLLPIFYSHWYLKADVTRVKFGTCTQTAI